MMHLRQLTELSHQGNPYVLVELENVRWHEVEAIAERVGYSDSHNPLRVVFGTYAAISKFFQRGDTWVTIEQAHKLSTAYLGLNREEWNTAISQAIHNGMFGLKLQEVKDRDGKVIGLSTTRIYEHAISLASTIAFRATLRNELISEEFVEGYIPDWLTPKQADVVRSVFSKSFTFLTGEAGSGKSSTTKAIVDLAKIFSIRVRLASPTGKAAKRLEEITGVKAETLHRLLYDLETPDDDLFQSSQPTIYIFDEMSMAELGITAMLMEAVDERANVLWVGDYFQLPSVGPGQLFRDVASSVIGKHPERIIKLSENHRQGEGSLIVTNANKFRKPAKASIPPMEYGPDFSIAYAPNYNAAIKMLVDLYMTGGTDVILTFFRNDRALINRRIQEENKHPGGTIMGKLFKVGDPIIQTKNDRTLDFFNGETGVVIGVEEGVQRLTVKTYTGKTLLLEDYESVHAIDLAYAITTHKAQGSEYDTVAIFPRFHESSFVNVNFLKRSLFYTAITRAKKALRIVTHTPKVIDHFRRSDPFILRNTMLGNLIEEMIVEDEYELKEI